MKTPNYMNVHVCMCVCSNKIRWLYTTYPVLKTTFSEYFHIPFSILHPWTICSIHFLPFPDRMHLTFWAKWNVHCFLISDRLPMQKKNGQCGSARDWKKIYAGECNVVVCAFLLPVSVFDVGLNAKRVRALCSGGERWEKNDTTLKATEEIKGKIHQTSNIKHISVHVLIMNCKALKTEQIHQITVCV